MSTFDAGLAGGAILRLQIDLAGQNIEGNYSVVNWSLTLIKGSYSSWTSDGIGWSTNIAGAGYSGSYTFDFRSSSSKVIASGSTQIGHGADGTLTFYASGHTNATGTSTGGPADAGGNTTLPTIPRASSASFTNPMTMGSTYTINISRASGSFTHTVQYFFGSASGTIATGVATSTNWTVPTSLLTQIPNGTSGTGFIRVITYSGATQIGYKDFSLTLTAAASVVPTIGGITDAESVSAIASLVGQYVQGMSKPTLTITGAAGVSGSTIKSYTITLDGQTISTVSGTVQNPLSSSGTLTITATVTDSRGRSASTTKTINVLAYAPPKIISSSTQRALASGAPAEEGTYIRVNLNASASDLTVGGTQKNKLVYKISTRARGGSVWSLKKTVTIPSSGIVFNNYDTVGTYAIEDSWEVLVEISDQFNTSSVQSTIATAKIFMHWGGQDEGLGIGKFWERGGVDILGQAYQNDGRLIIDEVSLVSRQAKLGTVDPYWTSGLPRVLIDGAASYSGGYMWDRGSSGTWRPTPGSRVYLTPSATGNYIISGPVAETNTLMNAIPLILGNFGGTGTSAIYDAAWHLPSVSMTSQGIIQLQGLWKWTVSPGAVDAKFGQLPDARYYPDRVFTFTVSANQTICRIQIRPDGSLWYINSASGSVVGNYYSLSNIRYPAAGIANWTLVKPFGDTTGPAFATSNLSGGTTTAGGITTTGMWWWLDTYGMLWLAGSYTSTSAVGTDNTSIVIPNGAWTITYQQHVVTSKTGGVGIGFGAVENTNTPPNHLVQKGTSPVLGANEIVHMDGVVIRTAIADGVGLTWIALALLNSWKNRDTTRFAPAALAFWGDLVVSRGLIDSGSTATAIMYQAPAGQRPASQNNTGAVIFPGWSNSAVARMDLNAAGQAQAAVGSNAWFSLDSQTWIPEQ